MGSTLSYEKRYYIFVILFFLLCSFLLSGCNEPEKNENEYIETINSGTFTLLCDNGLESLMKIPVEWYKKDYPRVKPILSYVTAREAMAQMLNAKARVIIISRDYLNDEDSLMKKYKVKPHQRIAAADDGLVFYTNNKSPLINILHSDDLSEYLTNQSKTINDIRIKPEVKFAQEPVFVINSRYSSEFSNFNKLVLNGKPFKRKIIYFQSPDSVKTFIRQNDNSIGIGYLSQIYNDTGLIPIRIGFNDSTGKYIFPQHVHQGYIVQKKYPYIVTIWVYLLEDRKNLPYWFATFIGKESKVQKYFLDAGIVPAYAIIKGIPEE